MELLTAKEASKFLRLNVFTLYKWTKEGKIPRFLIGKKILFEKSQLEAMLFASQSGDNKYGMQKM